MHAPIYGERRLGGSRFLTAEEASIVSHAAERWLRLRDVELNPGEQAAALLSVAVVRCDTCERTDIASIGRTMLLRVPGEAGPVEITLVRPVEEDLGRARVSILTELGLSCLGHVAGNLIRLPRGGAKFIGIKDAGGRPPAHHWGRARVFR